MKTVYEAWITLDGSSAEVALSSLEGLERSRRQGLLDPAAKLLHRIEADTPEEAMAVHHMKMGWAPYKTMGEAADCPNACGAKYYPDDSGICPNCGPIT